jgi:ribA/ribD-fused uncharacterized protein
MQSIQFYSENDKWGELSNFYPVKVPLIYRDKEYKTSEHLYQSLKYLMLENPNPRSDAYAELIRTASTPNKAKCLANKVCGNTYQWQKDLRTTMKQFDDVHIVHNWSDIIEDMMLLCLKLKYSSDPHCRNVLLSTGKKQLVEHTHRDKYWADGGDGSGKNRLGSLLMIVRDDLLQDQEIK